MDFTHRTAKAPIYYWEFLKRFGEECYRTWRQEISGVLAVTILTYLVTWQNKDAWGIASAALEANLIYFLALAFFHFVRTPYLLHRERLHPDQGGERLVHGMFGLVGAVVLLAVVAVISYRFAKPWIFQLPNITVSTPSLPAISQVPNPTPADTPGGKNSRKPPSSAGPSVAAQPPVQSIPQVNQSAAPQTQLDRLIQTDRSLTPGDRDRLSNALYDYAQFLEQGLTLANKVGTELSAVDRDRQNGSLSKNIDDHVKALRDNDAPAWTYSKGFRQIRDKWKYYPDQTDYIFGSNPDNLGPNALINTIEASANYLDNWSKISNKDQQAVLYLVAIQQNDWNAFLTRFGYWVRGCQQRLDQVKQSIQPNGVVQPNQLPKTDSRDWFFLDVTNRRVVGNRKSSHAAKADYSSAHSS